MALKQVVLLADCCQMLVWSEPCPTKTSTSTILHFLFPAFCQKKIPHYSVPLFYFFFLLWWACPFRTTIRSCIIRAIITSQSWVTWQSLFFELFCNSSSCAVLLLELKMLPHQELLKLFQPVHTCISACNTLETQHNYYLFHGFMPITTDSN